MTYRKQAEAPRVPNDNETTPIRSPPVRRQSDPKATRKPSQQSRVQLAISGSESTDDEDWDIIDEKERPDAAMLALASPRIPIGVGQQQRGLDVAGAAGKAAGTAYLAAKAASTIGIEIGSFLGKVALDAIQAKLGGPEEQLTKDYLEYLAAREKKPAETAPPNQKLKIRELPKGYKFERRLCAGGQATVELWRKTESKQLYAAKIFDRGSANESTAEHERKIIEVLRSSGTTSQTIVHCRSIHRNVPFDKQCTLVLEFCDLGDLYDWKKSFKKLSKPISEAEIWNIFLQLAEALAVLHSGYGTSQLHNKRKPWTPIVHRDLKPENILLKKSTKSFLPSIRLCDFGMSTLKDRDFDENFGKAGTTRWHGPPKGKMNTSGDVWALGAIIHYLCVGIPPVDELAAKKKAGEDLHTWYYHLPRKVVDIRLPPQNREELTEKQTCTLPWNVRYSEELHDILMRALDIDHQKRASSLELLIRIQAHLRSLRPIVSQELAKQKEANRNRMEREDTTAPNTVRKHPVRKEDSREWSSALLYKEVLKRVPL